MRIWIAALAAVAIQPLVMAASIAPAYLTSSQPLYGIGLVLVSVIAVAAVVIFCVGIPTFLVLCKLQRAGWTSLAISGSVLGALPVIVLSWPRRYPGFSSGQTWHGKYVDTYIDGAPTMYAWLTYGESAIYFGLHGLIGALVFYAVWRRLASLK